MHTCINGNHIDLIHGKQDFMIKNADNNSCYQFINKLGVHGIGGNVYDEHSWKKHHDNQYDVSNGIIPNVVMKSDNCNNINRNFTFEKLSNL